MADSRTSCRYRATPVDPVALPPFPRVAAISRPSPMGASASPAAILAGLHRHRYNGYRPRYGVTTNVAVVWAVCPLYEQLTSTGTIPGVTSFATVHDHPIVPVLSAVFVSSPDPVAAPDL